MIEHHDARASKLSDENDSLQLRVDDLEDALITILEADDADSDAADKDADNGGATLRALWDAIDAARSLFGGGCGGDCCGGICQSCEDEMSPEAKAARLADAIDELRSGAEGAIAHNVYAAAYFGYPRCCAEEFGKYVAAVAVLEAADLAGVTVPADVLPLVEAPEQTEAQVQAANGSGFVPCAKCAQRVLSGATTLEGLLTNRRHQQPFPDDSGPGFDARWKPLTVAACFEKGRPLALCRAPTPTLPSAAASPKSSCGPGQTFVAHRAQAEAAGLTANDPRARRALRRRWRLLLSFDASQGQLTTYLYFWGCVAPCSGWSTASPRRQCASSPTLFA